MKQHRHCNDPEDVPPIFDMAVPASLKREYARLETRRRFLGRTGNALAWASLAALMGDRVGLGAESDAKNEPARPQFPSFRPRANRAIYLFMSGGPPQQDLWDYKPNLEALYDKDLPESVRAGQQLTGMTAAQTRFPIAPSHFKFSQHGLRGQWISELLPWTSKIVDEIALIKSLYTDAINHE